MKWLFEKDIIFFGTNGHRFIIFDISNVISKIEYQWVAVVSFQKL